MQELSIPFRDLRCALLHLIAVQLGDVAGSCIGPGCHLFGRTPFCNAQDSGPIAAHPVPHRSLRQAQSSYRE